MQLQHIDLDNLKTTKLNVRKKGAKAVKDLIPSIRSLGIIQPLLVRPNCEGFEVVAGQRRFYALQELSNEQTIEPVPCIVMDKGDDAKVIEASLAENIARLPMDEIDQFRAFSSLIKQGNTIEDIASQFGVTKRLVKQRLAIANLLSPILTAYRKGEINADTIRILTMASKKQQKSWLELFKSNEAYAPERHQLKRWLFGGGVIGTNDALFDIAEYDGAIISDLFSEVQYFDDVKKFWVLQNKAIAHQKERYLEAGWSDVIVLDIGEFFSSYDHVETPKKDGGKIFVQLSHYGEVRFYEGYLPRKEAQALERAKNGEDVTTTLKPELTQPMQNYLDLHRHTAVRTELLNHQGLALRLAVAHIIAGSNLWDVKAEPQSPRSEAIEKSLETNKAEAVFNEELQSIIELLGITDHENDTLVYRKNDWGKSHDIHVIFSKLIQLDDETVLRILTFVMAETLSSGSALVEVLGQHLDVDMDKSWQEDQTFFDLLRDKQAINAMLKQVAGKKVADAHIASTGKIQKQLIQEKLKDKKVNWKPHYMAFPMKAYTKQGGIRAMNDWKAIKKHFS